jgi:cytochrome c oxidase assembly factor CtaG
MAAVPCCPTRPIEARRGRGARRAMPATGWHDGVVLSAITTATLLGTASAYLAGAVRSSRLGRPVRAGRWVPFAAGWLVLVAALLTPLDEAADRSFTAHMTQHLLLTFAAPPLLALGAPISLALGALTPGSARGLARALRSPVVRLLAHPVVGWGLFIGVPVALHASRVFDLALGSAGWHAAEHAAWVGAALVYWWPIVGVDPSPHPMGYGARLLSLLLAMPAMSFLALTIYSADAPLYATYAAEPGALTDQRDAAALMWVAGNLALVVSMLLVAASWKRHDDEAQRRLESREDVAAARSESW